MRYKSFFLSTIFMYLLLSTWIWNAYKQDFSQDGLPKKYRSITDSTFSHEKEIEYHDIIYKYFEKKFSSLHINNTTAFLKIEERIQNKLWDETLSIKKHMFYELVYSTMRDFRIEKWIYVSYNNPDIAVVDLWNTTFWEINTKNWSYTINTDFSEYRKVNSCDEVRYDIEWFIWFWFTYQSNTVDSSVMITHVFPWSNAEKAWIKVGNKILSINDKDPIKIFEGKKEIGKKYKVSLIQIWPNTTEIDLEASLVYTKNDIEELDTLTAQQKKYFKIDTTLSEKDEKSDTTMSKSDGFFICNLDNWDWVFQDYIDLNNKNYHKLIFVDKNGGSKDLWYLSSTLWTRKVWYDELAWISKDWKRVLITSFTGDGGWAFVRYYNESIYDNVDDEPYGRSYDSDYLWGIENYNY